MDHESYSGVLVKLLDSGHRSIVIETSGGNRYVLRVLEYGPDWIRGVTDKHGSEQYFQLAHVASFMDVTGIGSYELRLPKEKV